jgi:hypothetical protein
MDAKKQNTDDTDWTDFHGFFFFAKIPLIGQLLKIRIIDVQTEGKLNIEICENLLICVICALITSSFREATDL